MSSLSVKLRSNVMALSEMAGLTVALMAYWVLIVPKILRTSALILLSNSSF